MALKRSRVQEYSRCLGLNIAHYLEREESDRCAVSEQSVEDVAGEKKGRLITKDLGSDEYSTTRGVSGADDDDDDIL
jgi:hypothetical protein